MKVAEWAGQAMVITPRSAKHWLKAVHSATWLTEILLSMKRMRSKGRVMQVALRVGYEEFGAVRSGQLKSGSQLWSAGLPP